MAAVALPHLQFVLPGLGGLGEAHDVPHLLAVLVQQLSLGFLRDVHVGKLPSQELEHIRLCREKRGRHWGQR